jgi:hypothetical protein
MHRRGDITSARYLPGLDTKALGDAHLRMSVEQLQQVKNELAFEASLPE